MNPVLRRVLLATVLAFAMLLAGCTSPAGSEDPSNEPTVPDEYDTDTTPAYGTEIAVSPPDGNETTTTSTDTTAT